MNILVWQNGNKIQLEKLKALLGFPVYSPLVGILSEQGKFLFPRNLPPTEDNIVTFLNDYKEGIFPLSHTTNRRLTELQAS